MKKTVLITALALIVTLYCFPASAEETDYSRILVCTKAFEALGRLGDPSAKDVLLQGLRSPDFMLRSYAADALGRLNCKDAVPWLEIASRDRNYLVSIFAAKALVKLGVNSYEKKLLNFLNNDRPDIRALTVEQLGDFGDRYLFMLVRVLLDSSDPNVRIKAIEQLGRNKFNPALVYIKKAAYDKNAQVRQAACVALGRIGSEENAVVLNLRLSDPDVYVRAAAKTALSSLSGAGIASRKGRIKVNSKFIELLWKDTKSPNPYARASSYIALANLKDTRVVNVILTDITSPASPTLVRRDGARALTILKPYFCDTVRKRLSVSRETRVFSENVEPDYRINGKWLLEVFIGALQASANPLHQDSPTVLKELRESVSYPFLRYAIFDNDPKLQANALYALGELKDKDALADIIRLCKQYGF